MPRWKCKKFLYGSSLFGVILCAIVTFFIFQPLELHILYSKMDAENEFAQIYMDTGGGFTEANGVTSPIFENRAKLAIPMWKLFRVKVARLDPVNHSPQFAISQIIFSSLFGKFASNGADLMEAMTPLSGLTLQSVSQGSVHFTASADPQFKLTKLLTAMHDASVRYILVCGLLLALLLMNFAAMLFTCVRCNIRNFADYERALDVQVVSDKICEAVKSFWGDNWKLFLCIFLTGVFVYGYDITNLTFSLDEERQWQTLPVNFEWMTQGRWGVVIFRNLLLPFMEYPFISSIASVVFVALAYTLFIAGYRASFASRLVFGAVAISSPVYAYTQSFSIMSAYVGASMFLCAGSYRIFSAACLSRTWNWLWYALVPMVLIIATYQPIFFAFFGFLLVDCLILCCAGQSNFRALLQRLVAGTLFACACMAVYLCLNAATANMHSLYIDSATGWSSFSLQHMQPILHKIVSFYAGDVLSSPEIPFILVVALLTVLGSKQKWLTAFIVILTVAYMQSLHIVFLTVMPTRIFQQIPICVAGLLFALSLNKFVIARTCVFIAAFYMVCFNASTVTRLFLADSFQRAADEQIATRIINAMYDACPDIVSGKVPIAFVGYIPEVYSKLRFTDETFGASFWHWDPDSPLRKAFFLFSQGIRQFPAADEAELTEAKGIAQTMPCWPEKGFVQYRNGILIVHLSRVL